MARPLFIKKKSGLATPAKIACQCSPLLPSCVPTLYRSLRSSNTKTVVMDMLYYTVTHALLYTGMLSIRRGVRNSNFSSTWFWNHLLFSWFLDSFRDSFWFLRFKTISGVILKILSDSLRFREIPMNFTDSERFHANFYQFWVNSYRFRTDLERFYQILIQ